MPKDIEFARIRNLAIEKAKAEKYDRLKKDNVSLLRGTDSAEVFVQAMALGFKERRKSPLADHYRVVNIAPLTEEQEWMIKAVAVADTGGLAVLEDPHQTLQIAEEYANAGIDLLHERIYHGMGEYSKRLEEELRNAVKAMQVEQPTSQPQSSASA